MLELLLHNKSSMSADQQMIDTISNNIANMNTDGYKAETGEFSDLVYDSLNRNGIPVNGASATTLQTGTGAKINGFVRDNTEGTLNQTGQNTDFALDGPGYFKVITSNGTAAYERNGDFSIDASGTLVDQSGNRVEVQFTNGKVPLKEDNFTVANDGTVSEKNGNVTNVIGKINVYDVIGQNAFTSVGNNLYVPNQGAQIYKTLNTNIKQGYTEGSNVNLVSEMTNMLSVQRSFQLNSKGLSTADQMWQMVNSMASNQ